MWQVSGAVGGDFHLLQSHCKKSAAGAEVTRHQQDRSSPYSTPSTAVPPAVCNPELGIQGTAASLPAQGSL